MGIRRRLAAILAAALIATTFAAAPAQAHEHIAGGTCTTAVARFWGDRWYEPPGHDLLVCYGLNILRLSAYTHSGDPNACRGIFGFAHSDWNDCITSVKIDFLNVPAGVKLCLYKDDNYGGNGLVVIGDWNEDNLQDLAGGWTDAISSLKWSSTC